VGNSHLRDHVKKLEQDLLSTRQDLQKLVPADQIHDIHEKLRNLEDFMMENLAASLRMPRERSIDTAEGFYQHRKHRNVHGYGQEYFELMRQRYSDKELSQIPLREKASYLQVQANEMCERIDEER